MTDTHTTHSFSLSLSCGVQLFLFVFLSPIADYGPYAKKMLILSTGVGATCLTAIAFCDDTSWEISAVLFVLGNCAFGLSTVFYNGFLPKLTTPDTYDKVSTLGIAWGYFGGQLCLFVMFVPLLGISEEDHCLRGLAYGIGLTGIWWAVFAALSFTKLPNVDGKPVEPDQSLVKLGPKNCRATLTTILNDYPETGKFLLAYFVYSDGLSTIIDTVLVFADEELCMTFDDTIILLIVVDMTSGIGAWLSEKIVNRKILSTKSTGERLLRGM